MKPAAGIAAILLAAAGAAAVLWLSGRRAGAGEPRDPRGRWRLTEDE
jgi:hypothetical protein